MPSEESLFRRYPDLIGPDSDAELVRLVADLDAASASYRAFEPPPALEAAIGRLARRHSQRRSGEPVSVPRAAEGDGLPSSVTAG